MAFNIALQKTNIEQNRLPFLVAKKWLEKLPRINKAETSSSPMHALKKNIFYFTCKHKPRQIITTFF